MKPTNFKDQTCESKSSNCIIWAGPNIDCINLKRGDSVSWAVYVLSTRLCTLEDQFALTNFNLTQVELEYGPVTDFKDLINKIINKSFPTT